MKYLGTISRWWLHNTLKVLNTSNCSLQNSLCYKNFTSKMGKKKSPQLGFREICENLWKGTRVGTNLSHCKSQGNNPNRAGTDERPRYTCTTWGISCVKKTEASHSGWLQNFSTLPPPFYTQRSQWLPSTVHGTGQRKRDRKTSLCGYEKENEIR